MVTSSSKKNILKLKKKCDKNVDKNRVISADVKEITTQDSSFQIHK